MRIFLAFLLLSVGLSLSMVHAAELVWNCKSTVDPDFSEVRILRLHDKLVAAIYQESGDGEATASDLIEVTVKPAPLGQGLVYQQVEGSFPQDSAVEKPSRKTRLASILVYSDSSGIIMAQPGPTGDNFAELGGDNKNLSCRRF